MDRAYGTDHPNRIDVIAENDGVCYLYVIQADHLDDERTLALQDKLNNYLAFILDGQLEQEFPDKANLRKVVRVELKHSPPDLAADFLVAVGGTFEAEGIGFEYGVFDD